MSCTEETARTLAGAGRRVTTPRLKVASALRHAGGHRTAAEIYARMRSDDPQAAVSLATVYRTLETFRSIRIVSAVDDSAGATTYQWFEPEAAHHHLLCTSCGTASDIEGALFDRATRAIRRATGFEPYIDHLTLRGLCRDCSEQDSAGKGSRASRRT